ncbi:hypothetical protein AM499_04520 [Bacillus sp. FJAT-22090]|uniref:hypothetical protein n=1 Tax=Bacillus sp. FJAT-22090 TaxID=1581038 RepID=UPI0006AF5327|nr:hypothetical protein [Bacillus sp. FJAT-22090]ALC85160.1 hypothetical protein AM499_04520 [Bacillus sp. FJAT-22090]
MRKISILLFTIILLIACSHQETIRADGEGDFWEAHVIYEVTDSELYNRGGIKYTGDEELLYVAYSLVTDEGGLDGEREPQENQTAISFGTGVGNNPPTIDNAIKSLNNAYIEIKWRTNTGEYEEKVNLRVN